MAKKIIGKHKIDIEIVDWSTDPDEPGYDVNFKIDGKFITGGDTIFKTEYQAKGFVKNFLNSVVSITGGTLRG